ncbi:MAG: hypothetical protein NC177_00945 [Ruminococcus flavefaciens]|nr:hypothetical protein [Ruminococcus flavefaciens]
MKKLLAILAVCTMMTSAFASCGDDDASESSAEKSVSETEAETSETTTEEETTEETTEPETEEETTESSSAEDVNEDLLGMWYMEDDELVMGFNVIDSKNIGLWMDITEVVHFTADDEFVLSGEVLPNELISYDGETFSITADTGEDLWTMTKESGSADSYDGEYKLVSGMMYDAVQIYDDSDVYVIVSGENMYADYRNMLTYVIDPIDDSIFISGLDKLDDSMDKNVETTYEVKGDVLTLKGLDDNDEDLILKRFDLSNPVKISSQNTDTNTSSDISDSDRTTEGSVVGAWFSAEDTYGFRFEEDGTGGVFTDATEVLHFTSDGKLFFSSMTLEPETIQYDGTTLSVNMEGTDILTMTRNDGSNPDSFDGEYTFKSGAFYEGMVSSLGESFGISQEDAVVYAVVNGEEMFVEFAGLFTYSADNGSLAFEGLEGLGIPDGTEITYEFSGNNLIITSDGEDMILENIDL